MDSRHYTVGGNNERTSPGHTHHGRIVPETGLLDSTSERAADTLQHLVFNQTRAVPRFGGTHGTCLALDAVVPAEPRRSATPHAPLHECQTSRLGG